MRRWLKISLIAATILSPVYAQNAPSPAPLPPAMQSAIDRLAKGGGAIEEHRINLQNPPRANLCSVPLLEMHVDRPDRFSMRTSLPGSTPACEQTGR
jgi:hypothetical protein